MSLSNNNYNFVINLSADKIYSATLKAIDKLDYLLIDEDKKNNTIYGEVKKSDIHWKINLIIKIQNKSIDITTGINQIAVSDICYERSENLVKEIQKISKIPKKIILKNKSTHTESLKKDKSTNKKVWWFVAAIILVPLLIGIFSGGGGGGVVCKLSYANSSYCNYNCTKGDRFLWVPSRHPNPSAYKSYSNNGCPGWPPYFTVKEFDAAAK